MQGGSYTSPTKGLSLIQTSGTQSMDSGPAAAALPGSLLEMQALNKPPRDSDAGSSFKTTDTNISIKNTFWIPGQVTFSIHRIVVKNGDLGIRQTRFD